MKIQDAFVKQHAEWLEGTYDCLDRIVLNGYFLPGQNGGGMRSWWERLRGDPVRTLKKNSLLKMGWVFARRVRQWGEREGVPVIDVPFKTRKHELAEDHLAARRAKDPDFHGIFCVLVARAPGKVWRVSHHQNGQPHLEVLKPWPMVYHLHFHILDEAWGHVCFKISIHPPFVLQVLLNGHDWVERQARRKGVSFAMRGNAFVDGDFEALDRVSASLLEEKKLRRELTAVCERWVYSACLIHTMTLEEQERSGFRYHWSFYQLEYSRNLLFKNPAVLESCYQGLLDRTRRTFDLPKLKTLLGWRQRPAALSRGELIPEKNVNRPGHDVSVWKVKCGDLGFKLYDKTHRLLRSEATAYKVAGLRCGRGIDKAGLLVERMRTYTNNFMETLEAADLRTLDNGALSLLPNPSARGPRRVAGVDLNKDRMRKVCRAVTALAVDPRGFRLKELAAKVQSQLREPAPKPDAGEEGGCSGTVAYTKKQANYDLSKLKGKELVERIEHTHRYRVKPAAMRLVSGALSLRECILKPVLAGMRKAAAACPEESRPHRLDELTLKVQKALHELLAEHGLAA
jgi:hypothetical protein